MANIKLFIHYLKLHLKCELEYKVSLVLNFISQLIIFFGFYFVILSLFDKFKLLKGYTIYEVLLVFGIIQIAFSINGVLARGFDQFDKLVIDGKFDRLLTRPKNLFLQIIGSDINYGKLGRLLEAVIIFIVALIKVDIDFSIIKIITIILMIIGATTIFFGIYIASASFCFITTRGLEVINVFTDGGREMSQYPMNIYKKGFLTFFTFVIPYSLVNYYPLLYLLDRTDNIIYAFLPILANLFIIPCILVFKMGIKKYTSAGS